MKIVFTAKGTDMSAPIDPRFGRTEYFVIFDEDSKSIESYDNRDIEQQAHGAGPRTAQKLSEYGAQVLVTGNGPGGNAAAVLNTLGLDIYVGAANMTVQEAYDAYKAGDLKKA